IAKFPCCLSGPSFQQLQSLKPSDTVPLSGTITLSCRYNSGDIGDNNYPRWIQQKDGQVPRMLIHTSSTRPSGIPARVPDHRFSGSKSGNIMSMTITGALLEDEGDYYCVAWTEDAWHSGQVRWRNETKSCLTLSLPPSLPRQPLLPSDSHQAGPIPCATEHHHPIGKCEKSHDGSDQRSVQSGTPCTWWQTSCPQDPSCRMGARPPPAQAPRQLVHAGTPALVKEEEHGQQSRLGFKPSSRHPGRMLALHL
uniref:Ig-like domain-containing protein n=1 Tax=Varanus komodoensis TaxID=61221 RepID=A0A8D2J588_VARKO